jgi:dihydrofolate reductase
VDFVNGAIGPFVSRLREEPGKDIRLMGGGELIASFVDEQAIDEFVISVVPVLIGDGIPLIARRNRHVTFGFAVRRGWRGSTALPL